MINSLKLFTASFALFENAIIYTFVNRMIKKSCKCSTDIRREAIMTMTAFNFVIVLISLLNFSNIPKSYKILIKLYSLIYFIIVLSYAWKLKHSACQCSKGNHLDVIYYSKVIDISLIITSLAIILLYKLFN